MRRAFVLVSVVAAGLLGTGAAPHGPALAAAPRAAVEPSYTIENLYINRRIGDYFVSVAGGTDQEYAGVTISRGHETAGYETKDWQLEGKTLTVHLGSIGYLHMTFQGAADLGKRCGDRTDIDGTFKGQFRFRGEGGYLSFDLHAASGQLGEVRDPCPRGARPRVTTAARRAAGAGRAATLEARTSGPLPSDRVIAAGTRGKGGKLTGGVAIYHSERRGSLLISRATLARVDRSAFKWNLAKGSATVRPLAPISGRLEYHGRPGGKGKLTGTLRAPLLGAAPVVIHGNDLAAHLKAGVQEDE